LKLPCSATLHVRTNAFYNAEHLKSHHQMARVGADSLHLKDNRMNPTSPGNTRLGSAAQTFIVAAACLMLSACGGSLFRSSSSSPATQTLWGGDAGGRAAVTSDEDAKKVVSFVSQTRFGYVRIERAEDEAAPNDHSATLAATQLSALLGTLKVQKGNDTEPIFTEEELKQISGPLATALSKAGPREDVTFAVSGKRGPLTLFEKRTVTAGRVFYKNRQLNVIFGEIHGEFEDQFLATGWLRPFVTGSRAAKRGGNWAVVPVDGVQYASANRSDWIWLAEASMPPAVERPTGAPAPTAAPAAGSSATPAPARPAPPAHSDAYYQDIEKRLTLLKGLREKGLITEEEYNEKRKAILKEF
jgi:Short C-terminal domain